MSIFKKAGRFLVRLLYGYRTYNETILQTPGPILLVPNHVSWFDWLFIALCVDDDWRFVTSSTPPKNRSCIAGL